MRYDGARLAGFSVPEGKEKHGGVDLNFLLLVLLLIVLKSPTLLTCWLLWRNRGIRRWRFITRHGIEPISAISAL